MTNYYLSKPPFDHLKTILMYAGAGLIMGLILGTYLIWLELRDVKLLSINYCWSETGEHFVAPNPTCR